MFLLYGLAMSCLWLLRQLFSVRHHRLEASAERLGRECRIAAERIAAIDGDDIDSMADRIDVLDSARKLSRTRRRVEAKAFSAGAGVELTEKALAVLSGVRNRPLLAFIGGVWLGVEAALAWVHQAEIAEVAVAIAEQVRQLSTTI